MTTEGSAVPERAWCDRCGTLVRPVIAATPKEGVKELACRCGRALGEWYEAIGLLYPPRRRPSGATR